MWFHDLLKPTVLLGHTAPRAATRLSNGVSCARFPVGMAGVVRSALRAARARQPLGKLLDRTKSGDLVDFRGSAKNRGVNYGEWAFGVFYFLSLAKFGALGVQVEIIFNLDVAERRSLGQTSIKNGRTWNQTASFKIRCSLSSFDNFQAPFGLAFSTWILCP